MTIILGLDPGSRKTGFGVLKVAGQSLEYVTSGTIRINEEADWPLRLKEIFDSVIEIIERYRPQEVAIEQIFMGKNAASALKLGQARGAAIVAVAHKTLTIHEYEARKVKQAVAGTGAADKKQIQQMVRMLLKLPAAPKEDAADALAIAICHAHTQKKLIQLASRGSFSRGRMK